MYNRYIPGPDGSYRKNQIPDPCPPPTPVPSCPDPPPQTVPAGAFFKQLLPQNLDTGDLAVLVLLLLLADSNPNARSNLILTLALYFML